MNSVSSTVFRKHRATRESRLSSKEASDPVCSDFLWPEKTTPEKSRWSIQESCSLELSSGCGAGWVSGTQGLMSKEEPTPAHLNFLTPTSCIKLMPLSTWGSGPAARGALKV